MKNRIAAITLTILFTFGSSLANTGIIVQGVSDTSTKQCTETTKTDWGIIVQGVGIIVQGFTGIIVQGAAEETVDCGIIVQG